MNVKLQAQTSSDGPVEVLNSVSGRMIQEIKLAQDYFDQDPERFYNQVDLILTPVIDFTNFSRNVMGNYGSSKTYRGLKTTAEKKQFIDRIRRFSMTFKQGLIHTYAKGLLGFGGDEIKVEPLDSVQQDNMVARKSVDVLQLIDSDNGEPYEVHYKMRRDKTGAWKIRNVIIGSINLGKVYRQQFASAVLMYDGDIDKVIDTWSVAPAELEEQK